MLFCSEPETLGFCTSIGYIMGVRTFFRTA